MARRCHTALPLAAVAVLLLLACAFHRAAAGRLLPTTTAPRAHQDQEKNGVKVAAAGATVLQQEGAMGNGHELSQMTASEEEADEACQDDECVQRRLLHDAHLDYIYTQHKGKP
ncbi:hypothetical protein ACP4OV_003682 [Aristida adscensionis]